MAAVFFFNAKDTDLVQDIFYFLGVHCVKAPANDAAHFPQLFRQLTLRFSS